MVDYFIILLGTVIVLLAVQIIALLRVRSLIRQFRQVLKNLSRVFNFHAPDKQFPEALQKCQFCKFRQSFWENESTRFYYQCALDNQKIQLNHSCSRFQPEKYYLDKTEQNH